MRGLAALLFLGLLLSCDAPVAFERTNPADPESEVFTPTAPIRFSAEGHKGNAVLAWEAKTDRADGYLVERSIGDSTSFEEIARAAPEATAYVDSAGPFDYDTYYRLSAYRDDGDQMWVDTPRVAKLDIGKIGSIEVDTVGDSVHVSWHAVNTLGQRVLVTARSTDSYLDFSAELPVEQEEVYLDANEFGFRTVQLTLQVVHQQEEGNLLEIDEEEIAFDTAELFMPTGIEAALRDEESFMVEWDADNSVAEHFEITRRDDNIAGGRITPPPDWEGNETVVARVEGEERSMVDRFAVENGRSYYYAVHAVWGDTRAKSEEVRHFVALSWPRLRLLHQASEESVQLEWDAPRVTVNPVVRNFRYKDGAHVVSKYVLERKEAGGSFQTLAELDPTARQFEDETADQEVEYVYRIRTLLSHPSDEVPVSYQYVYEPAEVLGKAVAAAVDPKGQYVATSTRNPAAVRIWNAEDGSLLKEIPGGPVYYSLVLGPEGRHLAANTWSSHNDNYPNAVRVWDWERGELLFSEEWPRQEWGHPHNVAIDPASERVAAINGHGAIRIWEIDTGELLHAWNSDSDGNATGIRHVSFHPEGDRLVADSGPQREVEVWNIEQQMREFRSEYSRGIASFSQSGDLLALRAGGENRILSLPEYNQVQSLSEGWAPRFLQDERLLALSYSAVEFVVNLETGKQHARSHSSTKVLGAVHFDSRGRFFVEDGGDVAPARIWRRTGPRWHLLTGMSR